MVANFISYLQYEKRFSRHTIVSYSTDLQQLTFFFKQTFDTDDLLKADYQMLRSWLYSLNDEQLKPRSLARKIACLKSFYKFLLKHGHISTNPTLRLKTPKVEKRLPVFLSIADMNSLLDKPKIEQEEPEGFPAIRNKLVMEMLYGTGIRLAELIGIKERDYNKFDRLLKVLGKGNKERILPVNTSLAALIDEYLKLKRFSFSSQNEYLIVTDKGDQLYPVFVQRLVKATLTKNEIHVDKKSPHVLRHTFATHLLNRGADLNAIKDLLGHSSLAATQVYTHNSIEKLKQAFEKAHPKA
ncbi:MAG: tyrosine-type recombinase/integrase [Opitutaceae bacterium]|nr:tyrosine-type recombinase/integrase [Cytophagales bacterium]